MKCVFLGDFALAVNSVRSNKLISSRKDPFSSVAKEFGENIYIVGNLEGAITGHVQGKPNKWVNLRMEPHIATFIGGIDLLSLSNNHIGDFGSQGVKDTISALQISGLSHFGYGNTLADAIDPYIIETGKHKVGISGLCCPTTNSEVIATHQKPGVVPISIVLIEKAVSRCKSKGDFCILYLHWGCEWVHDPAPDQLRLERHAIDCSADAVLGCHSHTIQSYEQYKGKWIFYGLGNYCFDAGVAQAPQPDGSFQEIPLTLNPQNKESLAVSFKIKEFDGCASLELDRIQPFRFDDNFLPAPCNEDQLTFDLSAANNRLKDYVDSNADFLDQRHEVEYRCMIRNGVMAYWYQNESIISPPRKPLKRELANTARCLFGRLKKTGKKALHRYLA